MFKLTSVGVIAVVFLLLLSLTQTTRAALLSFGDVVYDSNTNLTWLADANLAATNTFGVAGINSTGGF